jgi:hypothetical protein
MKQFTELEDQIRECFGRVVYTHKTHEKMADRAGCKLWWFKTLEIGLASITASGVIAILLEATEPWIKWATTFVSLSSVFLTTYLKDFDLGAIAQKHRDTGSKIWSIRESYLSLLTDLRMNTMHQDQARKRREELQEELGQIYLGAPQTDGKAYIAAQKALKDLEDYSFSKEEINKFLPDSLKKP